MPMTAWRDSYRQARRCASRTTEGRSRSLARTRRSATRSNSWPFALSGLGGAGGRAVNGFVEVMRADPDTTVEAAGRLGRIGVAVPASWRRSRLARWRARRAARSLARSGSALIPRTRGVRSRVDLTPQRGGSLAMLVAVHRESRSPERSRSRSHGSTALARTSDGFRRSSPPSEMRDRTWTRTRSMGTQRSRGCARYPAGTPWRAEQDYPLRRSGRGPLLRAAQA